MPIVVVPPDPSWPELFHREAEAIRELLGPEAVYLHHIGSTAVPGLAVKPIIDILLVVRDVGALDHLAGGWAELGYEAMGEYGLAGRRYYRKGTRQQGWHVHAYALDHPDIERHLAFRDYLRASPVAAHRYGALKQELALRHPGDRDAYMAGKEPFIREAEAHALAWWRPVPVIALSGPVGVGKTTVGEALAEMLGRQGIPHLFVDQDRLTDIWPRSPGDPFAESLGRENLRALWRHARSCGARCLIVPRVLESAQAAAGIADAVPGAVLTVVRLEAPYAVLAQRLSGRERGEALAWHLARARELSASLPAGSPADIVLDATQAPLTIAERIFRAAGLSRLLAVDAHVDPWRREK